MVHLSLAASTLAVLEFSWLWLCLAVVTFSAFFSFPFLLYFLYFSFSFLSFLKNKNTHTLLFLAASNPFFSYLDIIINISREKISVDDVLRGLVWDLRIVDPQARVVKVFKAVREKMLQHGLTEEHFSEKSRIKDSVAWLLCHRR